MTKPCLNPIPGPRTWPIWTCDACHPNLCRRKPATTTDTPTTGAPR